MDLRLAIIAMAFPAGSETFVSGRVKTLHELGVSVEVYSLRPDDPAAEKMALARGVADVKRSSNSPRSALRGFAYACARPSLTFKYCRWLFSATRTKPGTLARSLLLSPRVFDAFRQLAADPPEVVHAEWGHYPALVLWLVQERLPSVATSISLNAYDLTMEFGGSIEVARRADLIRTHTSANIPHVASFTGIDAQRVELVYNGVNVAAVDEAAVGTAKVPGRVVTVARMIPEKRIDLVIRAFATVTDAVPHAELRVLGAGQELQVLEDLVKDLGLVDKVKFLGHVDHQHALREIAEAEVLMLLSETLDERLPNVVKEGMAARCVCITTRSVGIEELVEDGFSGFVVEYGDVDAAARSLLWALTHPDEAAPMGSAARAHVTSHFDHDTNVRRFLELWQASKRSVAPGQRRGPRL